MPSLGGQSAMFPVPVGFDGGPGFRVTSSGNWSGYAAYTGTGTFSSVSGKWQVRRRRLGTPTIPRLLGRPRRLRLRHRGAGRDVRHLRGHDAAVLRVVGDVSDQRHHGRVRGLPGDFIAASVVYAKGSYKITVNDTTPAHATNFSTTQTCASNVTCARASAECDRLGADLRHHDRQPRGVDQHQGSEPDRVHAGFATPTRRQEGRDGAAPGLWQVAQVGRLRGRWLRRGIQGARSRASRTTGTPRVEAGEGG